MKSFFHIWYLFLLILLTNSLYDSIVCDIFDGLSLNGNETETTDDFWKWIFGEESNQTEYINIKYFKIIFQALNKCQK